MRDIVLRDMLHAVGQEATEADSRYGPFASAHEGYGVLAEEMAELLDAIRANDYEAIKLEAIQCSAVALRIVMMLDNAASVKRSGLEPDVAKFRRKRDYARMLGKRDKALR